VKGKNGLGPNSIKGAKVGEILTIPLFGGNKGRVLEIVNSWNREKKPKLRLIATINPEHVMAGLKDRKYGELLGRTDLNVADGIGLVWGREVVKKSNLKIKNLSKLGKNILIKLVLRLWIGFWVGVRVLKKEMKGELIPGCDLMVDLIELAAKNNKKVMFLGGWGDRAQRAASNLKFKIENSKLKIEIVGFEGEPKYSEIEVLNKVREYKPEMLFVAYGMKRQEEWIWRNREALEKAGVRLAMGVGRSFDYLSGDLKRAPEGWQKTGFEWLYSLLKEPKRWRRQLALGKFLGRVVFS
jgi:N-acetylglucosaminyldiphosphoundecaprenol N-acetyl-beta-D-mannosaminyltransferase